MHRYFFSIAKTLLQGGIPIVISFVLGNFLPPDAYGEYVALLLLSSTVAILAAMPVDSATIRYILKSKTQREQNRYYTAGVLIVIFNAVLVCFILVVGKSLLLSFFKIESMQFTSYIIVIALGGATVVYAFYAKLMTVKLLFKEQIVVLLVSALLQGIAIGCLILVGDKTPISFLSASLIFFLCGIIYYENRLRKEFRYTSGVRKQKYISSLVRFSSFIYLGALAGFLDEKIDLLCINTMLSKEDLACYSYAILLGFILYGIGLGVSQVTFPLFCSHFSRHDLPSCERIYRRTLNYLFLLLSFLGLTLLYNAPFFIELLLPEEYLAMLPSLSIIIPGIVLFAVFAGIGTFLTAAGKPQYGLWLVGSFMVVNLFLNILLIPVWGILGAALATSSTFLARSLVGHWLNQKITGLHCPVGSLLFWYCVMVILMMLAPYLHIIIKEIVVMLFVMFAGLSLTSHEERVWLRSLFFSTTRISKLTP